MYQVGIILISHVWPLWNLETYLAMELRLDLCIYYIISDYHKMVNINMLHHISVIYHHEQNSKTFYSLFIIK